MKSKEYMNKINSILKNIEKTQMDNIMKASALISNAILDNKIVHFFGCGHSLILCEEVFYRAGGLACLNPIFDTGLMVQHGAIKSSVLEKQEGYAKWILERYNLQKGDAIVIFSTSGRNPVPIDAAIICKDLGLKVIGVTSLDYSKKSSSRHSSNKNLYEFCDVVIDNCVEFGDALLDFDKIKAVPGSTIAGAYIINSVIAEAIEKLNKEEIDVPILMSGNIDGGGEYNEKILKKYKGRIKHL
ncbi:SIS domain-containing protein [Abyssisolibacter fermentans]|uniref:SIS domain-containing protein n=1 Tax=Abyssisolibacter fermentans TaxID=1766203 RepID=UPI000830A503|nr:SIS domain-containing protein [Abyssisolibacter fermentans]